jgi:hypothetical protein
LPQTDVPSIMDRIIDRIIDRNSSQQNRGDYT